MQVRNFAINFAWLLFSPTRRFIDWWKAGDSRTSGDRLRAWSLSLFALEAAGCAVLSFALQAEPTASLTFGSLLALLWAWSRVNEIGYAFYRDALSPRKQSDLTPSERIQMAMRSFYGLSFNFALLYYFLPVEDLLNRTPSGFWETFYFSGVTLATVGYGDISPIHPCSQLLAIWEVGAGILIVAVAVATYAGRNDA